MESKVLLDLSIKYGLNEEQISKLASVLYQLGYTSLDDAECERAAGYACAMKLVDLPGEEIVEEMRRKGFGV